MAKIIAAGAAADSSAVAETTNSGDALDEYLNSLGDLPEERDSEDTSDEDDDEDAGDDEDDDEAGDDDDDNDDDASAEDSDPKDPAKVDPKAEDVAKDAVTPEELQTLREQAEFGSLWSKGMTDDPAGTIGRIAAALGPEFKADLLKALGAPAADAKVEDAGPDFSSYEPYTDLEAELVKHIGDIRNIKALPETLNKQFEGKLSGFADTISPFLDHANAGAEVAHAKLDAILKHIGLDLPSPDMKAVLKAVDGGKSYREAVRENIGDAYDKQLTLLTQAKKTRPETPGGSTSGITEPEPGQDGLVSLRDINRAMRGTARSRR